MRKLTIESMREMATLRGGKCLSSEYLNNYTRLMWACFQGHEWSARPGSVKKGSWCPHCSKVAKHTIEEMNAWAVSKKGKCLSSEYRDSHQKLTWQCGEGHVWTAKPANVLNNDSWCPTCAGIAPLTVAVAQKLAKSLGGVCLSSVYVNNRRPLKWRCARFHEWEDHYHHVKHGRWCARCVKDTKQQRAFHHTQELARINGGLCLANGYTKGHTKTSWQCAKGHTWNAPTHAIKKGYWCPECCALKNESSCKDAFESLLGVHFPKGRPLWLRNSRGYGMELDGYCEALCLAFEYQGQQHYRHVRYFHRTLEDFIWQQQRDAEKRSLCKANGVTLIEVPYNVKDIEAFVREQLAALGLGPIAKAS